MVAAAVAGEGCGCGGWVQHEAEAAAGGLDEGGFVNAGAARGCVGALLIEG